ncbi:MAG TPA: L,D-transpeptidase [Thermomicrobiales bacterium]|jgi:lipoprotein-anchoring transpeptidase ErfK/SrfK
MARRATWIVLLALLLAPIVGSGAVAPVFAQDGNGDQTAVTDSSDATPDADLTEDQTGEATPTDTATPTEESTPTEEATPTDEATATETATPTDEAIPTQTPTNTPTPTSTGTPKGDVGTAEATSKTQVKSQDVTPQPTLVTTVDDIKVRLNCRSNPEKITVTNNGQRSIIVQSIGSIYSPLKSEPFATNKKIWAGKSRDWFAGPTASGVTMLVNRLFLNDSAWEKEGVVIQTSVGEVTTHCPKAPPTTTAQIKVTINCTSDPEKIRVTNNGFTAIVVKSITTLYQPTASEPFVVNQKISSTKTKYWTSGGGATNHVLTTSYILTNAAYDKEGVKVVTSAGNITVRCPKAPPDPFGGAKWIEVNLSTQYLIAWQNGQRINETYVSTGRPGFETPTGTWYVNTKLESQTMSGCIQGECYYVPDVPWVMYFTDWGHALHGTYWHNNFGHVMSHGCVNLPLDFAEWLYYWTPIGTPVVIHY